MTIDRIATEYLGQKYYSQSAERVLVSGHAPSKRKSVIKNLLTGDLTEATRKTLERRLAELRAA